MEFRAKIHEHGELTLTMSTPDGDLMVVNSARVSFAAKHDTMTLGDEKLIVYLVKNKHDSPLRHVLMTFRIKAPEFVMRQWYKHIIGACFTPTGYTEPDHAWNEMSGRYVEYKEEFYIPDKVRVQSKDNKQATLDESIPEENTAIGILRDSTKSAWMDYQRLLELGVGREQARMVLPLSFYTEVIWTASLQAVLNFISLRDHPHAQKEIRDYAIAMKEMVEKVAPVTMKAWNKHRV